MNADREPRLDDAGPAGATPRLPGPPAAPRPASAAAPRRVGWLGWWLAACALGVLICAAVAAAGLSHMDTWPMHVVIDGDEVFTGGDVASLVGGHGLAVFLGLSVAALVVMFVVPMVLLIVLGAVGFALVAGLGLPLVLLALAFAVLTSPLWLFALALWILVRNNRRRAASATIRA